MVTDIDRIVLAFLAEHRIAQIGQIARLLGVTERTARWRLGRLEGWELIARVGPSEQKPYVAIARAGLAEIRSRLPEPAFNAIEARHDLGLGWVWLAARDGAFGELAAVHSERAMRSADRRAGEGEERFGLRTVGWGPRGGPLTHYPDLLLETADGHRIGVELELTQKAPARLEKILRRYVADRRLDGVVYLVDDVAVARQLQRAATRAGASELVHIQQIRWTADARSREPGRGRGRGRDRPHVRRHGPVDQLRARDPRGSTPRTQELSR